MKHELLHGRQRIEPDPKILRSRAISLCLVYAYFCDYIDENGRFPTNECRKTAILSEMQECELFVGFSQNELIKIIDHAILKKSFMGDAALLDVFKLLTADIEKAKNIATQKIEIKRKSTLIISLPLWENIFTSQLSEILSISFEVAELIINMTKTISPNKIFESALEN